jgi:phage shock protein A
MVAQPERKQAMTGERWKQQIELLGRVNLGLADLTQWRERVQTQIAAHQEQLAQLEQQLGQARQSGRDDLAQEALTRLNSARSQIAALKSQLGQVLAERVKLTAAAQTLQAKIDGAGGTTVL